MTESYHLYAVGPGELEKGRGGRGRRGEGRGERRMGRGRIGGMEEK